MRNPILLSLLTLAPMTLLACSGEIDSSNVDEGAWTRDAGAPSNTALGNGSAKFTTIFQDSVQRQPIDLDFNPSKTGEMWIVNFVDDTVTVLQGVGAGTSPKALHLHDPAADHFMHRPTGLSFGDKQTWATCGDGNNGGNHFMGPTLFSSDLSIFAKATPEGLGSHLDMLHLTSFCRGITHETANAYWTFNGEFGSVERYDFHQDHGPGHDDHSDGTVYRYLTGALRGVSGVPSHLAYASTSHRLYIADTGNGRIVALDTQSGKPGRQLMTHEPMADAREITGASASVLVPAGTVQAPSGLALAGNILYVTDARTSTFYAFSTSGKLLGKLATNLPPGSLAGLRVGPDGKIYFADRQTAKIVRIDP